MQGKREQWAEHVAAWAPSGRSQVARCREHGGSLASFGYWRRKLAQDSVAALPATPPIRVAAATQAPITQVRLPSGGDRDRPPRLSVVPPPQISPRRRDVRRSPETSSDKN